MICKWTRKIEIFDIDHGIDGTINSVLHPIDPSEILERWNGMFMTILTAWFRELETAC